MHSPREALTRLNPFDRSYLTPSSKAWIGQIAHAGETGADLDQEIRE